MEVIGLRETQKISLEILKIIKSICEEQHLRYYLVYGTLIGAVRHKGFIPWDDDLDIMMPRPDHDKFCECFSEYLKLYPHLKLFNHDINPDYPYMISRVSDSRYTIVMDNEKPYGMGVFVDIYPYDGMGNTWKEAVRFQKKGDLLSSLCFQSTREHFEIGTTKSIFRKILKYPVFLISKKIGKEYFQDKLQKIAGQKPYNSTKFVGNAVWGSEETIYPVEWFEEFEKLEFEGEEFCVPKEYDKFLRRKYGDYMKLPKEKDRTPHHGYYVIKNKDYEAKVI